MTQQTNTLRPGAGLRRMAGALALATLLGVLGGCAVPNRNDLSTYQGYPNESCESLSELTVIYTGKQEKASSDPERSAYQLNLDLIRYWQAKRECTKKAVMGVSLTPIDPVLAKPLGLDSPKGAVIKMVIAGAPGERAGLVAGDIILGVNGEVIGTPADVVAAMGKVDVQGKAELLVWRNSKKTAVLVDFAPASANKPATGTSLMDAATADFDAGRYADAARKYQQILQQSPDDFLTWYFYGQTMEKLNDLIGAQEAYRRVLAIQPKGQVADYARQALARLNPASAAGGKKAAKKK